MDSKTVGRPSIIPFMDSKTVGRPSIIPFMDSKTVGRPSIIGPLPRLLMAVMAAGGMWVERGFEGRGETPQMPAAMSITVMRRRMTTTTMMMMPCPCLRGWCWRRKSGDRSAFAGGCRRRVRRWRCRAGPYHARRCSRTASKTAAMGSDWGVGWSHTPRPMKGGGRTVMRRTRGQK
jgi:hypothetical protein